MMSVLPGVQHLAASYNAILAASRRQPFPERGAPMSPEIMVEISTISAAIVDALREAHQMARDGDFGDELNELVRHAREMCELLMTTITESGDDLEAAVRTYAVTLAAGLENMERVIAGSQPN
jgi:hypothetical protein